MGTAGAALVVHVARGRWALGAHPRLVVEGAALLGGAFGGSGAAGAVTRRHLHVGGYVLVRVAHRSRRVLLVMLVSVAPSAARRDRLSLLRALVGRVRSLA